LLLQKGGSFQLQSINKLLEGSATVVDINLPTGAQKTRGRPQGKKVTVGKKLKTDPRDPSEFKIVAKKRQAEEKAEEIQKKTRIQPSRKAAPQLEDKKPEPEELPRKIFKPVRTASKKNPLPESKKDSLPEATLTYYLSKLPKIIQPHVHKLLNPLADGHCGF